MAVIHQVPTNVHSSYSKLHEMRDFGMNLIDVIMDFLSKVRANVLTESRMFLLFVHASRIFPSFCLLAGVRLKIMKGQSAAL